jgi:hypothetical protein
VLVALLLLLGLVLTVLLVHAGQRSTGGTAMARPVAAATDLPAARLLRSWDERRSAAYAAGSEPRLRDLYVAGSAAGASDVRLLRAYRARGFRVVGMRMQVLALRVQERGADRVRVQVTDRLDRAVAVRAGRRVVLPRDTPDTRVLTLVRGPDGSWRVAAVVPVR